jgi:signal transduction histidine kinase
VVGHSLAVILAQAESAQYVADDDPEAMQKTMRNIADSARASLQDVRAVLTSTSAAAPLGGLDSLVDGVRQGGYEVAATAAGRVQPLPPELAAVAYRVLQEMLTNAIKHGRRDRPVEVLQAWPEPSHPAFYLRLKVVNTVGPPSDLPPGSGLDGMRRRLESVGGHLQAGRSDDTFTATAWIPVRPASGEGFPL